jgi:hypothetical protein
MQTIIDNIELIAWTLGISSPIIYFAGRIGVLEKLWAVATGKAKKGLGKLK